MAKVIIQYEAETASLKAAVSEVNKVNDEVVKSAQDSSAKVAQAYKDTGKAAAAAFASNGVKKAIDDQNKSAGDLAAKLKVLYAEEVKLLDAGQKASKAYQENQKQAEALRKQIASLNDETESLVKATQAEEKATKSLSSQLRAYKNELAQLEQQGKENTKEFEAIAVAAAKLEDQIGDTRERVKSLASDTFVFDAAIDSVNALAGGFAVVQGAVGLFAEDNQELQEAIAKTNSALAILNGLQQVQAFLTGQSAGKLALLTAGQTAYAAVVGTSTGAMKLFRIALAATGVGLLVVGLVALVENFDKVKAAVFRAIPGLEAVSAVIGKAIDTVKEFFGVVDSQERDTGVNKFIANERRRTDAAVAAIDRRIKLAQAENKETFRLEIEKEKILKDFAARKLAFINNNQDLIRQANIDTAQLEFDLQQEILDREATIQAIRIANRRKTVAEIDAIESKSIDTVSTGLEENKVAIIDNSKETEAELSKALAASIERENKRREEIIKTRDLVFQTAKELANLFNSLGELSAQLSENRIANIQEQQQFELEAIDNSVKTERQKQREREALELRTNRKIAAEKIKQARLDKSIALFNAVVNTAEAVTKALPNPILAAAAAAAGAAQIALIAARPIPKFERGGVIGGRRHSAGGTIVEAERDEYIVNRNQSIKHRNELEAINTSTASFRRLIDERYVRPAIQNFMLSNRGQAVRVNATLNSKSMEQELKAMRKSMKRPVVVNIATNDRRTSWR